MFETRIQTLLRENLDSVEKVTFLNNYRKSQIKGVIESLNDQEFTHLQTNIIEVFHEVQTLLMVTKRAIESNDTLESVLSVIENEYRCSNEVSQYYKELFLEILSFLRTNQNAFSVSKDSKDGSQDTDSLGFQFYQKIILPIYQFQSTVYETICDRKKIAQSIITEKSIPVSMFQKRSALFEKISDQLMEEFNISLLEIRQQGYELFHLFFTDTEEEEITAWNQHFEEYKVSLQEELKKKKRKVLDDITSDRKVVEEIESLLWKTEGKNGKKRRKNYHRWLKWIMELNITYRLDPETNSSFRKFLALMEQNSVSNKILLKFYSTNQLMQRLNECLQIVKENLDRREEEAEHGWIYPMDRSMLLQELEEKVKFLMGKEKKDSYLFLNSEETELAEQILSNSENCVEKQQQRARMRKKVFDFCIQRFEIGETDQIILYDRFQSGYFEALLSNIISDIEEQKALEAKECSTLDSQIEEYATMLVEQMMQVPVGDYEIINAILQKNRT